jgi:hypothetical protein
VECDFGETERNVVYKLLLPLTNDKETHCEMGTEMLLEADDDN